MIGIYKITSPSGKVYIGQTWSSDRRFSNYRNLYCKYQTKLYNSLKKHGFDKHKIEIIHELPPDTTQKVMDLYEEVYMTQYRDSGIELMNLREPGSRGKHSEETKRKCLRIGNQDFLQKVKRKFLNQLKAIKINLVYLTKKLSSSLILKEYS